MSSLLTRASLVLLTVVTAMGFVVSVLPSDAAAQVASLYGRGEWQGYFSGSYTTGQRYGCGDNSGRLMCDGIYEGSADGIVNYYWGRLYGGDEQHRIAAAFTILAMVGVNGPDTGGVDNGVNMARARFDDWASRVRSYGAAGRINFSQNYSFTTNTAYRNRDVLWRNDPDTADSIVFTLMDGSQVAIKKSCANLVGAAYLPAMDYGLSASSSANRTTGAPGDRINWSHDLRNNGPSSTSQNTYSHLGMSGFSNGWGTGLSGQNTPAGAGIGSIRGWDYNVYDITQNDVGNTLCQWVEFDPINSSGARDGRGNQACVSVPYNYTLIPQITNITDGQMIESDAGSIPVQGRVTNSGPTKSHPGIQWQITQIRYRPGTTIPNAGGGTNPGAPCAYFAAPGAACNSLSAGTEAGGYGHNATVAYSANGSLGDEEVGTRLCYAMSIQRASSATGDWGHSRLFCFVVGKKPKIQVNGGDVIVGRGYNASGAKIISGVTTSSSNKGGTYYGSWGEYAIIPSGTILGMASASGYAGGVASNNLCNNTNPLNLLSFSNANKPTAAPATCNALNIGRYSLTSASQYDAIAARFAAPSGASTLTGNVNVASLTAKTIYRGTGAITLSSTSSSAVTPMPAGKWVIINAPEADVRITSDLTYADGPFGSIGELPQLVIIARNIVITDNVQRIDAWLYAKGTGTNGTINTCDAGISEPTQLTSRVCNNQLSINGPVVANHLLLYRTHGSDTGAESGTPAELFNLRPDTYMWASTLSGIGTKARTVITTELPPRF